MEQLSPTLTTNTGLAVNTLTTNTGLAVNTLTTNTGLAVNTLTMNKACLLHGEYYEGFNLRYIQSILYYLLEVPTLVFFGLTKTMFVKEV